MDEYKPNDYNFGDIETNSQTMPPMQEKKGMPSWGIVLIVVGVVGILLFGIIFMGVIFLWANSFTSEEGGVVHNFNVRASIDTSEKTLTFEVISGTIEWFDFSVVVDGTWELSTTSITSSAGDNPDFSSESWEPQLGMEYSVKIIDIQENLVRWVDDVIAAY